MRALALTAVLAFAGSAALAQAPAPTAKSAPATKAAPMKPAPMKTAPTMKPMSAKPAAAPMGAAPMTTAKTMSPSKSAKPMVSPDRKTAISKDCSAQADAKNLHGKDREKFRGHCKSAGAKA